MSLTPSTPHGTPRNRDPEAVARIVNAAWTARQVVKSYRASLSTPTPETFAPALERRCEALEAAIYYLAGKVADAQATGDYALERAEARDR